MRTETKKIASKLAALAISSAFILASGCNSGGGTNTWTIEGVTGPTVTMATNQITISAVLQNITVSVGGTVPIPNMPNSTVEIAPDVSGGLLLQAVISAGDIATLSGGNTLPPQELPGGRALPGVAAGELPAIAVQVPQLDNVVFYIGPSIFGAFIPVAFDVNQIIGTYDFYGSDGSNLGQISMVGEDSTGANSGFLLMLNIDDTASSMMKQGLLHFPLN